MIEHNFISGSRIGNFYDVLPKNLTLNINKNKLDKTIIPSMNESLNTIFKEVKRIPFTMPYDIVLLDEELLSQKKNDTKLWVEDIYNTIKSIIFKTWNPEKIHIIGHSSGWDSRVMSKAIMELYKEHGKEWLGETYFIEVQGEYEPFVEIMKSLGWTKKNYIIYNKGVSAEMHHDYGLNFINRYNGFYGMVSYPVNQWYDPYMHLGFDESNSQFFTGYGANEVDEKGCKLFKSIAKYKEWHYNLQLNWFKYFGETIFVFWDYDYIRKLFYYSDICNYTMRVTEILCMNLGMYDIPRLEYTDIVDYKICFGKMKDKVIEQYKSSSYYHYIKELKFESEFTYNEWWANYCTASIVENLKRKNYTIKY
jgi:hypothetical protein